MASPERHGPCAAAGVASSRAKTTTGLIISLSPLPKSVAATASFTPNVFRDDDHKMADRIISFGTIRLFATTKEEQLLVGQTCWLAVAENEPSIHTGQKKEITNVRQLTGCPDENACGCAVRSRNSFHRPDIDGYACVCVRRVRSKRPSRSVGRLQIWRPKSSLVPATHRPCGRLWSIWDAVVQVRRLPLAPRARAAPTASSSPSSERRSS